MNDHVRKLRDMAAREIALAKREAEASRLALVNSGHHERNAKCFLAGAEALERLEAMKSTVSTMSPKSASVSEEGK